MIRKIKIEKNQVGSFRGVIDDHKTQPMMLERSAITEAIFLLSEKQLLETTSFEIDRSYIEEEFRERAKKIIKEKGWKPSESRTWIGTDFFINPNHQSVIPNEIYRRVATFDKNAPVVTFHSTTHAENKLLNAVIEALKEGWVPE